MLTSTKDSVEDYDIMVNGPQKKKKKKKKKKQTLQNHRSIEVIFYFPSVHYFSGRGKSQLSSFRNTRTVPVLIMLVLFRRISDISLPNLVNEPSLIQFLSRVHFIFI